MKTFSQNEYNADYINWSIKITKNGEVLVGNNSGILIYNGERWSQVLNYDFRTYSIDIDSFGRIFWGNDNSDFGFLEFKRNGIVAHSLTDEGAESDKSERFWGVHCASHGNYFVSNHNVYYKSGNQIQRFEDTLIHNSFLVNDVLFVRIFNKGLFYVNNDGLQFIEGSEIFSSLKIYHLELVDRNSLRIFTREGGAFLFRSNKEINKQANQAKSIAGNFQKLDYRIEDKISRNILYCGLKLKSGLTALGFKKGVVLIVDHNGEIVREFSENTGYKIAAVNALNEDEFGGLWIATDNGIVRIEHESFITKYDERNMIKGKVESINIIDNKLHVATPLSLYVSNSQGRFEPMSKTTENWFVHRSKGLNEKLGFLCSKEGLFKLNSSEMTPLFKGQKLFVVANSKLNRKVLFGGGERRLFSFVYSNDKLEMNHQVTDLEDEIRFIEEDDYGNIWFAYPNSGIGKVSPQFDKVTHLGLNEGLPDEADNIIRLWNNRLLIGGFNGIYSIKDLKSEKVAIQVDDYFLSLKDRQIENLQPLSEDEIFVSYAYKNKYHHAILVKSKDGQKFLINNLPFKKIGNKSSRVFYYDEKTQTYYIATGDEISVFNFKGRQFKYQEPFATLINGVYHERDTLFAGYFYQKANMDGIEYNQRIDFQPENQKPILPFEKNDLTFNFSSTWHDCDFKPVFSYYLEGEDKGWSGWTNNTFTSYQNLEPGTYKFRVKSKNIYGVQSPECVYEFTILPPWYRTIWAYGFYFLAATGFVYLVVRLSTKGLNKIIKNQTREILEQKFEIEEKNKEITDSLVYARRIQDAIFPPEDYIKELIKESFILYKPKDIVSGDFFWASSREDECIIVAADCTGHGVPGAFMSMMGNDLLNEIIVDKRITQPDDILNMLRAGIIKALKQTGEEGGSKDGMDLALVRFNSKTLKLEFSGANNPIYIIRDAVEGAEGVPYHSIKTHESKSLYEIKSNRFPVGIHHGTTLQPFMYHTINLHKGDRVYLFSDGYADQFGGADGKKLKYVNFKQLLLESSQMKMEEQKAYLDDNFISWKRDYYQVDDILVVGFEV
jgi:serine phosphatase RsbU (regulator of sigma subunit)